MSATDYIHTTPQDAYAAVPLSVQPRPERSQLVRGVLEALRVVVVATVAAAISAGAIGVRISVFPPASFHAAATVTGDRAAPKN